MCQNREEKETDFLEWKKPPRSVKLIYTRTSLPFIIWTIELHLSVGRRCQRDVNIEEWTSHAVSGPPPLFTKLISISVCNRGFLYVFVRQFKHRHVCRIGERRSKFRGSLNKRRQRQILLRCMWKSLLRDTALHCTKAKHLLTQWAPICFQHHHSFTSLLTCHLQINTPLSLFCFFRLFPL